MTDTKRTEDFSNVTSIPIRTRLALWLIVIAIKLCEPWEYAHQFSADLDGVRDLLKGKK